MASIPSYLDGGTEDDDETDDKEYKEYESDDEETTDKLDTSTESVTADVMIPPESLSHTHTYHR